MYQAIGGDKESSIHGGRNDLEAFEMSESSVSLMHQIPNIPKSKGTKSKMSQSQSSAKQGTTKSKKAVPNAGTISDTKSVKSSVSKGTKKKKKASNKAGHDGESNDSDTSRTQTIAPP